MIATLLIGFLLSAQDDRVRKLEAAYAEAEFEEVASTAAKMVADPSLANAQRARAYELGGFAEFFLNRQSAAEGYFRRWLEQDPNARVDERRYPPKAIAFFRSCRTKYVRVAPPPPAPARAIPARARQATPATGFSPLALIPFGIGHLALGDVPAGVAFMLVPAALIGASVALYWVRVADRLPGDQYANPSRAFALQVAQDVAAFSAAAIAIGGVIDAALNAQRRAAERETRVTVAPFGAGLSFGVSY